MHSQTGKFFCFRVVWYADVNGAQMEKSLGTGSREGNDRMFHLVAFLLSLSGCLCRGGDGEG